MSCTTVKNKRGSDFEIKTLTVGLEETMQKGSGKIRKKNKKQQILSDKSSDGVRACGGL